MLNRRPRSAGLAALLALALVAGCGGPSPASPSPSPSDAVPTPSAGPSSSASAAPSPSPPAAASCSHATATASFSPRPIGPDDPNAALLAGIEGQVESIRGLTATRPVPRNTLDQAGLCAFLRQSLDRDTPPALLAATERLYKQLGLMPADQSLATLVLDLMTSQVVGFYDPDTAAMYIIAASGALGPMEQIVYAHEFDHALQDQAFGLREVQGAARDQGDRSLARKALIEGDATLLMSLWAQRFLTPAQLLEVAGAVDPASQAALDAAPPILRETLMWPYTQGLGLTLGAYQTSASFAGVDALWKRPPDTTAQVIHPDKLASRVPAVVVAFPADLARRLGAGWTVALEDTLGELQLNIVMRTGDPAAGQDPAAGWGGDRVALVEGPGGAVAAVVDSVWATATAADGAAAHLELLATRLSGDGRRAAVLRPDPTRLVLISADGTATLGRVANVLGLAQ